MCTGATCPDGSNFVSKVEGSVWIAESGAWVLVGCPEGYSLSSQQCLLCPAATYCVGGSVPATSCGSGLYSLPGSNSSASCVSASFVIVTVSLPILRENFDDTLYQQALGNVVDKAAWYVLIEIVAQSNSGSSITVTSYIAMPDDYSSNQLQLRLNSSVVGERLAKNGYPGSVLLSVQVSGCVPGYELLSSQICGECPPNYFCVGGALNRQPCSANYFSRPGSNSSSNCKPAVFIELVVSLSMPKSNFTDSVQLKFREALAITAHIEEDRVSISSYSQGRRSSFSDLLINANLAADNTQDAATVSSSINPSTLNSNLNVAGLPSATIESVIVSSGISAGAVPISAYIGGSIGGFIMLLLISISGIYMFRKLNKQYAHRAFLLAHNEAKSGEVAHQHILPLSLRGLFVAERILGKGAFGCVVLARRKNTYRRRKSLTVQGGEGPVAIKLILPQKGAFEPKDIRQLKREQKMLELFTARKCEHAVQLASGIEAVEIRPDSSWFIMELLEGSSLDFELKDNPIDDVECIKVSRNTLAALKVMHSEGVVHRDIKPANIMRCKLVKQEMGWDGQSYTYKLIDFGTVLGVDESLAKKEMMTITNSRGMGEGTPPYMSPEMFKEPDNASYPTDIWSLGVTMFELVTGKLPFQAESELLWSSAIAGDMDEKAASVFESLDEGRRAAFDSNLVRVIAQALEKNVAERYQTADEMHEAVYECLIARGEAFYSVFISYRVASEAPLARLLFDELNHTVTPGGHRVTVYWDAHRLVKGEDWEAGFATGLLNSLCFFPVLSYGATAPLATISEGQVSEMVGKGWDLNPVGRQRLKGEETDWEDNVLKEFLIAVSLLDRLNAEDHKEEEEGILQLAYPILVGRQQPLGHPDYPKMGNFFQARLQSGYWDWIVCYGLLKLHCGRFRVVEGSIPRLLPPRPIVLLWRSLAKGRSQVFIPPPNSVSGVMFGSLMRFLPSSSLFIGQNRGKTQTC